MDITTMAGFLGAILLLFYGIWSEGALSAFLNVHGVVIVLGGTFFAAMVNSSLKDLKNSLQASLSLFFKPKWIPPEDVLPLITSCATKVRRLGNLSIEEEGRSVNDDGFFSRSIEIALTTNEEALTRLALEKEVTRIRSRHLETGNVFRTMGVLGPMFGLLGTLVGIISVLKNISDPETAGPAMAVAISSAFYGILLANLFCVPVAGKLRSRSLEELLSKEIMIEGLMDILFSDRIPTVIEMRLLSYLKTGGVRGNEASVPKRAVASTT